MSQKRKRKLKLRYDRIILFVVLPVIFITSLVFIFRDNSDNEDTDGKIKEFMPVIYLSPSSQDENQYADGDITEAEAMRAVSESAEKYLKQHNVKVIVAEENATLQDKVRFSNTHKLTAHVAIHSNTGNGIKNMGGTDCYYNSEISGSKALSEYIYNNVSRLTPTNDHGISDGTQGATYLYEVAESRTPSCMVEVEYHDSIGNARWIIENTDELGKAIADGILQYIDIAREQYYQKYSESGETESGEQDQLSEGA